MNNKENEKDVQEIKEQDPIVISFRVILRYPVFYSRDDFEEAMDTLRDKYESGDRLTKNSIIHTFYNMLMKSAEFKMPRDDEYFLHKQRDKDIGKARTESLRAVLDFPCSIEGTITIIEYLAQWRGTDVVKMLTSCLSNMLCRDLSEGTKMIKFALIDALGESNDPYALEALLVYIKYCDGETAARMGKAIAMWEEKLKHNIVKLEKEDVEMWLKKIEEIRKGQKDGRCNYYA
jgi:hypothetical protein